MFLVQQPTMQWVDPEKNVPLQRGLMYFGQPNLDPKVLANRIAVYYYNEMGNLAELQQPVELSNSGVPIYLGKQVDVYINVNCSIRVDDRNGEEVYYINEYTGSNEVGALPSLRVDNLKQLSSIPAAAGAQVNVTSFYSGWSASNGRPTGGGLFAWSSTIAKSLHNGVTVYAPEALAAWNGTQADIATLLNWTGAGMGAWVRVRPTYNIRDVGGGDGVSDNSLQLQRLLNVTPTGSTASIAGAKVVIDSSVTVTDLRSLAGDWVNPDLAGPPNAQYFNVANSAIYLNSAATINLGQSSSIRNVLIYRKGMTFPTSNDSEFAGTALTASSSTASVSEVLVMGFNKLFFGTGQRYVLDRVFGDNASGIEITGSLDVSYITRCHMWPFSANTLVYPNSAVNRSGKAFYLRDIGDWVKMTDCFSYAYKTGFDFFNVNSVTAVSCSADHNFPNTQGGSIGFHVRGTCKDIQLQNPQAAAQSVGIQIETTDNTYNTMIMGGATWSNSNHSILVSSGSARIGGGITLRNAPYAVGLSNNTSLVQIDDALIKAIPNPFVLAVATNGLTVGDNIRYEGIANGSVLTTNLFIPTIASAGNINMPATGTLFSITGNVAINFLTGYYTGRTVTFVFTQDLTVLNGGSGVAGIRLSGNVNFVASAGSSLTLRHDGNRWVEIGRCA